MIKNVKMQVTPEQWLQDARYRFPIYKMQQDGKFIVGFDGETSGEVVWVKSNSGINWEVGHYSENWIKFTTIMWKDVDIDLYLPQAESLMVDSSQESTKEEISQGTIVQATRKSTSENYEDYSWQGVYFGHCNGKHLIDANTTHVMLADEVQVIPMLTKKEAKQKVSELFANPKNITSEKVRNIIDLIKL